jgi:hypothetical protein
MGGVSGAAPRFFVNPRQEGGRHTRSEKQTGSPGDAISPLALQPTVCNSQRARSGSWRSAGDPLGPGSGPTSCSETPSGSRTANLGASSKGCRPARAQRDPPPSCPSLCFPSSSVWRWPGFGTSGSPALRQGPERARWLLQTVPRNLPVSARRRRAIAGIAVYLLA